MKYLILGDGLLGTYIHSKTGWDFISRKKDKIDFTNIDSYIHYLQPYDQILNCIGYTDTLDNNKLKHWDINYVGVIDLVNICNKLNKKIIHISTDYIYNNSIPNASEKDIPIHYNNWYTYTKLLSDGYIQAKSKNYLLIRTSFKETPFKWNKAWLNLIGNFDYINVIGDLIIKSVRKNFNGVLNIGTNKKNMYELALKTKSNCEPINNKISEGLYPFDISMDLNKLKLLLND